MCSSEWVIPCLQLDASTCLLAEVNCSSRHGNSHPVQLQNPPRSSKTLFLPSEIKLPNPPKPLHLMICLTSHVTPKLLPRRKRTSKGKCCSPLCSCFSPFRLPIAHCGTCPMHRYDKEGIKSLLCISGVTSKGLFVCICMWFCILRSCQSCTDATHIHSTHRISLYQRATCPVVPQHRSLSEAHQLERCKY